eukprot:1411950-Rhodomonas_salina.1
MAIALLLGRCGTGLPALVQTQLAVVLVVPVERTQTRTQGNDDTLPVCQCLPPVRRREDLRGEHLFGRGKCCYRTGTGQGLGLPL